MDLVIACAAGLTAPLTTTPGDVATLRGFAVNVANPGALTFAWLPRRGEAATLCAAVIGCYLIGGSMTTGASAWASSAIYLLPIQSALSWVLVGMFVPAARSADAAASARVSTTIEHDVATTRRAAEREHWAMLHDTAASTLLMVGEGVPITANGRIRLQAERDVNAIRRPSGGHPPAPADLADAIRRQIEESPVQVDLQVAGRPIVPAVVLDATLGAVRELLTNVERHSGTLAAAVTLTDTPSGFELLVHDDGFGFDCVEVGRGLRESVIGRMRRAGATVLIESTAHSGTDVRVRWSDS